METLRSLLANPLFWTRIGALFTCVGTLMLPITTNEKLAALSALGVMFGFGKADPQPASVKRAVEEAKK